MRVPIIILALLLVCGTTFAQVNWTNEPIILKQIKGSTIRSVTVKTLAGNIAVIGTNAQPSIEVYVDAINEATSSKAELKRFVEQDYAIDMVVIDHQLTVSATCKYGDSNWKKAVSISFKIFVPRSVVCNLNSKSGSVSLVNLDGNQTFATNGAVNLEQVTGIVRGHTGNGDINVSNTGPDIDLATTDGNIVAVNCQGKVKLKTDQGSINLSRLKGTIDATTTAGNIQSDEIDGTFNTETTVGDITLKRMACHLNATTASGTINAELSKNCKSIKLNASEGDANITIPAKDGFNLNFEGKSVTGDMPKKFSGTNDGKKLLGAVYGGGIPVEVHAVSGEVKVQFI
ncbi:DUF4097 family beta strand repeat-containing protein [Mucilaginibacter polytrichastri]|uniref:DUF4097 domain-containing protein n=1 Tax=Mucilaginibacter polytrichastri TaxID=1302689 RepID=A0A1Q5ZW78_9SPHI|nr:DUF4097 family beta strand repeat-containing protein [Mucilaginibacter polytrichastri]OKS85958.1 hypothetical protein RG47T_1405 [Mucilaginibacter polytrichastri]SFS60223.1 DUF4097 and DUF4098 domain-containing protein YvlB [Mucilaginibacter polytrichastri]